MQTFTIEQVSEFIHELYGISVYKEQLQAVKRILKGDIIEMKTGEGKSIVAMFAAAMLASQGRKVFQVTSNDYLSNRDYQYSKPLFEKMGIKSCSFEEKTGGDDFSYKESNIIYATGATLIFDYLRGLKVDYDLALIDEIDFILIENSSHEFSICSDESRREIATDIFYMAKQISQMFAIGTLEGSLSEADKTIRYQRQYDAVIDEYQKDVTITTRGYNKILSIFKNADSTFFLNLIEVIQATLNAEYCQIKGVDYIVENNQISLINTSNGRVVPNGRLGYILATAVEIKEGVPVTDKDLLSNSCSYPVFFSIFNDITGMSGTASYAKNDFIKIYGKDVAIIKEHQKNKRIIKKIFYDNDSEVLWKIGNIIESNTDCPILVITDSDKRASQVYESLPKNDRIKILDNSDLINEEDLLAELVKNNQVLVSTKIVGRGTDISLSENNKGFIVIIPQAFHSKIAEWQAIGRAGRNGQEGTVFMLSSPEDPIFIPSKEEIHTFEEIDKLQEQYVSKEFETRKRVYLKSKLFFDRDKAIKSFIYNITSFEEIAEFYRLHPGIAPEIQNDFKQLYAMFTGVFTEKNPITFSEVHQELIKHYYDLIRLVFQEQYNKYLETDHEAFANDQKFHEFLMIFDTWANEMVGITLNYILWKSLDTYAMENNIHDAQIRTFADNNL